MRTLPWASGQEATREALVRVNLRGSINFHREAIAIVEKYRVAIIANVLHP